MTGVTPFPRPLGSARQTVDPDIVAALRQYRDDMVHPPSPDSRARRVEMIDHLLTRIEPPEPEAA